ncbi:unnamed protein product, partial [Heligmosomoides polygyrus]|uniref:Mitochondrial transcription termination factor family protein n=1 Tax=Heligmosomoides polygyrus TaxID=6339 RepID=A0A183GW33_HELPZ
LVRLNSITNIRNSWRKKIGENWLTVTDRAFYTITPLARDEEALEIHLTMRIFSTETILLYKHSTFFTEKYEIFTRRAFFFQMKHLLVTQRSLRKACLEAGYDRNKMTADQVLAFLCQKTLPSTEFIDDFLYKNHYRSEENRQSCRDLLKETKRTCLSLAGCCAPLVRKWDPPVRK